MAKIQCKMCGGELTLPEGVQSGTCEYCGSLVTFPKISGDQMEQLYNRAEHFRRINEYDKAVAAHVFIPWLMVWDKLPSDDNVWKVGLQVWGPDPRSLSGIVHELERCLRLKFELTPEQTILIKRKIAKMAFNRYNALRQDPGEKILTWNDPVLGDPAFYESVAAPFIKELDEAGERLMKPASDAEIPEIFEKFVPLWAEIRIVLSEMRGKYLKRKFMEAK